MKIFRPPTHTLCLAFRSACVVALLLCMVAANPMHAQRPAGTHHPAGVPDNYVITPFGYFHPSCVIGLAKGDTQVDNGHAVQHQDGSVTHIAPCAYPRYTAKGEKITEGQSTQNTQQNAPSIVHNWIEDYETSTNTSFGVLVANWIVPQTPMSNDGQTVYMFPGLEDINDAVRILQPVLGWNADFTSAWGIASWNYSPDGNYWESTPVPVNLGDTISGSMQSTCSAGTLTCSSWNIVTNDETTGQGTSLLGTSSEGQTFNWAFAGVLEVYNIAQCSDYPPNDGTIFSSVFLADNSFNTISNPRWTFEGQYNGLTPQCNYGGQASGAQVEINYGASPPALPPTYTQNTAYSQSSCYNYPFGDTPCSVTYTSTISVAQGENLYINGQFVNGGTFDSSYTENWGTGQCSNFGDQGYYCYGYATPSPLYAYATEPGDSESSIVAIYF